MMPSPTQDAVLAILQDGEWHRTAELMAALNLTLNGVSGAVRRLRTHGHVIERSHGHGYRLCASPDMREIPPEYEDWYRSLITQHRYRQREARAIIFDHIEVMERRAARVAA